MCDYINSKSVRCPIKKLFYDQGKKYCKKHFELKSTQRELGLLSEPEPKLQNKTNDYQQNDYQPNDYDGLLVKDYNVNIDDINPNEDDKDYLLRILKVAPEHKILTKKEEQIEQIIEHVENEKKEPVEKPGAISTTLELAYWTVISKIDKSDESMNGLLTELKQNELVAPNVLLACHEMLMAMGIKDISSPAACVLMGTISTILIRWVTYTPTETVKNNIGQIKTTIKKYDEIIIPGDKFHDL